MRISKVWHVEVPDVLMFKTLCDVSEVLGGTQCETIKNETKKRDIEKRTFVS